MSEIVCCKSVDNNADGLHVEIVVQVGSGGREELTLRLLMSYIHGAPILDVSRLHTTTQHSR